MPAEPTVPAEPGVPAEPAGATARDGAPRRATVDPAFAVHGARGVVRYYDHAVRAVDERPAG